MDKKSLTAPCGLDCFNCFEFESNITEERKKQVADFSKLPIEQVPCRGCQIEKGCKFFPKGTCTVRECIEKKNIKFCHECNTFPCDKFNPTQKGSMFPHNLKLYNSCRIKLIGIDKWIEEADEIRAKYYKGKFVVGKGPVLEI
jgi:hypothetical protein